MASITIRNLDAQTKQKLRERAARNGNSMEEEARLLLGTGVEIDRVTTPQQAKAVSQTKSNSSGFANFPASGKSVLLIISGGIAAYKSLDLIRRLKERGVKTRVIMTKSACEFISPLTVGALSHDKVFTELFNREDEQDIGHIRLAREADLIIVAPTTANLIVKMAMGLADDLASAVLLASTSPILLAPAMNPAMWNHPATQRNIATLINDGVDIIGPVSGEMAERNEVGKGRLAQVMDIVSVVGTMLDDSPKPLAGLSVIMTAGPTHEPIDPVRYIANRSSGKQGYAIAEALARAGAKVSLVSGPVDLREPENVDVIHVETALQMQEKVETLLPADIAIMVAAVADWRTVSSADEKIKKKYDKEADFSLQLTQNPDILKGIGHHKKRPELVVGFAAETENIIDHAKAKLKRKGADWIVANDVSPETGVMGGDTNTVKLLTRSGVEEWPTMDKQAVAGKLVEKIILHVEAQIINV